MNLLSQIGAQDENNCTGVTKAGTRCKAKRQSMFHLHCRQHETEASRVMAEHSIRMFDLGRASTSSCIERMQKESEKLQKRLDDLLTDRMPMYSPEGYLLFQCGNHTYGWNSTYELKVGDFVFTPPSWLHDRPMAREVTKLGSYYKGELSICHTTVQPEPTS